MSEASGQSHVLRFASGTIRACTLFALGDHLLEAADAAKLKGAVIDVAEEPPHAIEAEERGAGHTGSEVRLAHYAQELERRVEERTRELENIQARLRDAEDRFRLIVDGARDYAIFTIDLDGRISGWHGGAEAVFGWTREEAVGRPVEMTFTLEDRAARAPERERDIATAMGSAPNVRWHLR